MGKILLALIISLSDQRTLYILREEARKGKAVLARRCNQDLNLKFKDTIQCHL